MSFLLTILALAAIHAVWALGARFLEKRLDLRSLGHAAIGGTGAYVFALSASAGWPTVVCIAAGVAAAGVVGIGVTTLSDRVVSEDYALITFALQLFWFTAAENARCVTGGPLGLSGLPQVPGSVLLGAGAATVLFSIAAFTAGYVVLRYTDRNPFAANSAIVARSGELAMTLGISSSSTRAQVGLVYGMLSGLAAIALVGFIGFIGPSSFSTERSVVVLAIAFLAQRSVHVFPAALLLVGTPDLLRLMGLGAERGGFLQMMLGGLVVAIAAIVTSRRS